MCNVSTRIGTSSILAFDPGTLKIPSVLIPICAQEVHTSMDKYTQEVREKKREQRNGGWTKKREMEDGQKREKEKEGRKKGRKER